MPKKANANGEGRAKRPSSNRIVPKTLDQLVEDMRAKHRERDAREFDRLMRDNRAPFL